MYKIAQNQYVCFQREAFLLRDFRNYANERKKRLITLKVCMD